ncbi:DUF222 domain-containing protein, partial [uncultured Arthrobacter sp.]|uniref:DUF222 domain-containing protein n=1 Tax=uncultured Arthrobacter sp. TaxID=114050 RepID=UPI00321641CE
MGSSAALSVSPASRAGDTACGVPSLGSVLGQVRELCATAIGDAALFGFAEAAEYAAGVEELARGVEFLQLVGAAAVDRTRKEAAAADSPVLDDGYRKSGDFLRDRLQITGTEAHRRLSLTAAVLPRTGITGQILPPLHEELAAAVAAGTVPSRSATIIAQALDRVRPLCDPATTARMEHSLTATAAEHDPDFLARVTRRWLDAIDQDGAEPSEEVLRQLQGAFIRKPRHGLHHLEIFATTEQFETLLTVMNTATNPRTTPAPTGTDSSPDATSSGADGGGVTGADGGGKVGVAGEVTGAEGFVPGGLDWRSRPQKYLDGLVGGCKIALASGGLPATGGHRPQIMVTIDYRDLLEHLLNATNINAAPATDSQTGPLATAVDASAAGRTPGTGAGPFGFTGTGAGPLGAAGAGDASGRGTGPLGFTGTGTLAFTGPVTAAT